MADRDDAGTRSEAALATVEQHIQQVRK
jgi:hypothetical protein